MRTFFDEIRQHGAKMPSGRDFPPLFNFTSQGMCVHVCISEYVCVIVPVYSLFDRHNHSFDTF